MVKMKPLPFTTLLVLVLFFSLGTAALGADSYPSKPIRLVIPFAPGGSNDIVGRMIANQLSERLGKQVVVDNRGGAGGVLGAEIVSKSDPDGYTLLVISSSFAFNPALYKVPYDPNKAFTPVTKFASGPVSLVIHPSVPANSVKDLIALMKEKPGKMVCSSSGAGSFQHLAAELFKSMVGVNFTITQFKGGGPSMIDTIGGHSELMFGSLIQTIPHIQSGKLKVLGTGGSKRSGILPQVPTIAETGVPGYEANNWWGMLAPAGTPKAIVERLNKELSVILTSAETKKRFLDEGAEVDAMGPDEFGKFITGELHKWAKVVKDANIEGE